MNNKKIFKNPVATVVPIADNYHLAVNPSIKNGLKVINDQQLAILNKIEDGKKLSDISAATSHPPEIIKKLVGIFSEIELCGYSPDFSKPTPPERIKHIDFWVHTTDSCNFNCPYCYIDKSNDKSISEESMDLFIAKLKQEVNERDLAEVSIRFSGGEPMLKFRQVKEYVKKIKKNLASTNCKLNIGFLTNLSLLNEDIYHFIKQEDLYTSVSLDGFGQYHDRTRFFPNNKGSFETVDKNINYLLESGHKRIIIMSVLSDHNLDGLPEFAHYLAEKNIPFRFSVVTGVPINKEKLKQKLLQAYDVFEEYILKADYPFTRNHHLDDLRFLKPSYRPCNAGFLSGGLYNEGSIYFCQQELGNGDISGSVHHDASLIESIQTQKHRHTSLNEDCHLCNFRFVCSGGCPLYRVDGKSSHCELYKEILPRIYQLIGLERLQQLKKKAQTAKKGN
ncbi:MAG: radical SAM protein [Bacteroidota bacterium]